MREEHYFFALALPETAKNYCMEASELIKQKFPFKSWVHEADLHITLVFLGPAPKEKLDCALKNMPQAVASVQQFALKVKGFGIFGRPDAPRVLWGATEDSQPLNMLRSNVASVCSEAGFEIESRPFKPHITLARKWKGNEDFNLAGLEQIRDVLNVPPVFTAREAVLYKTHPDRTPKYEKIASFPLEGQE